MLNHHNHLSFRNKIIFSRYIIYPKFKFNLIWLIISINPYCNYLFITFSMLYNSISIMNSSIYSIFINIIKMWASIFSFIVNFTRWIKFYKVSFFPFTSIITGIYRKSFVSINSLISGKFLPEPPLFDGAIFNAFSISELITSVFV